MTAPAKRTRGRPKGSRNKSKIISGATVEDYCKIHNHNPTEFLIRVATGEELPHFKPTHDDILRANVKLHDSIHHGKGVGAQSVGGEILDGQFSLVFEEASLPLQSTSDASGVTQALPGQPVQRAGDTQESW